MGSLKNLTDRDCSIHLLQTNSSKADMYVHDTLKATYNANLDCVFTISNKKDLKTLYELSAVQPYVAEKWIFEIDYKAIAGDLKSKKGIFESPNICYCIRVDRYKDFKEFKSVIGSCNDLYLSVIRRSDIDFLLSGYEISDKVKVFIASSYNRDVEKVFAIRDYLNQGGVLASQREVVKLVGASSGSINGYIFQLLTAPPKTEKGEKRVYKNRIQHGLDLCRAYGVSTFRNFFNSAIYDILQIKQLYMEGIIYDRVSDLPVQFDEKKLSKYGYYLDTIKNSLSYESILGLYMKMQLPENKVWYRESDFVSFLYDYYGGLGVNGIIGEL